MENYKRNCERAESELSRLKRQINQFALGRLAVILLAAFSLFRFAQLESVPAVIFASLVFLLAFFWMVYRQSKLDELRNRWSAYLTINQNELNILSGLGSNYDKGEAYVDAKHPYTDDLDIFGERSLYAYLNRCSTPQGKALLAEWLKEPAEAEIVRQRQQAVRELAEQLEWGQEFQVDLWGLRSDSRDLKAILTQYVEAEHLQFGSTGLQIYVKFAPWLLLLLGVGGFFIPVLWSIFIWVALGNLLATFALAGPVGRIMGRADKAGSLLSNFAQAITRIERREWTSSLMRELASPLKASGQSVSVMFRNLARILEKFDYRLNMLVGAFLNMFFLWDFRQVFALQNWRELHGQEVLVALDLVGEVETLWSLALVQLNHSHWSFPEVIPAEEHTLEVEDLAHPLIPRDQVVSNSYVNRNHYIALITGSNMAGKSTFLRTVGINVVLALSGAPVCARKMKVSVMHLLTYMRIKDSLQESTSTFKAELNRIKMILEHIRQQPYSYFLVDEMLRGTNSVDKYKGSKAIIERMISDNAHGMVATHDLQLSELAVTYPDHVRNYHFDIQVQDGEMIFDYRLKDGACTIFNASILLRGIGIEVNPS